MATQTSQLYSALLIVPLSKERFQLKPGWQHPEASWYGFRVSLYGCPTQAPMGQGSPLHSMEVSTKYGLCTVLPALCTPAPLPSCGRFWCYLLEVLHLPCHNTLPQLVGFCFSLGLLTSSIISHLAFLLFLPCFNPPAQTVNPQKLCHFELCLEIVVPLA